MSYSIVYSSRTGNTKILADAILDMFGNDSCVYFGPASREALKADVIYVGFWTDKSRCDKETRRFLRSLKKKRIFLFGTAGSGSNKEYCKRIIHNTMRYLDKSVKVSGVYMCQGRMPMTVRKKYMLKKKKFFHAPGVDKRIENFDRALVHPNLKDLRRLQKVIRRHRKLSELSEINK